MKNQIDWAKTKVDAFFLVKSGLLFEINRTVLNVVGLSLAFDTNGQTVLKDMRAEPEKAVFDRGIYEIALDKLNDFMKDFGGKMIDRRRAKLGWAYQPAPTIKGAVAHDKN